MKKELQPLIKSEKQITFHKDNTVSFYCEYDDMWKRLHVEDISVPNLATFTFKDRSKIFAKQLKK